MNFIWDRIADWLKGLLISGIMGNLDGLFDSINGEVSEIAGVVGATPQAWNGSVFGMIQSLSNTVMLPIAGVVLTAVACVELIQMIVDRNNMHDFDVGMIFKWVMKTAIAVLIVTNTWNIIMGTFDLAQSVVNQASGVIVGDASISLGSVISDLDSRLQTMDVGALFGLWLQSSILGLVSQALTICIFVIVYGRMVEVYLTASVGPIPMATMANHEWGQMGQNYLRSLFALGFQAFLIMVCVAIYAALVRSIAVDTDVIKAIWTCVGYTVLLCFTLFKTSSVSRGIFGAH